MSSNKHIDERIPKTTQKTDNITSNEKDKFPVKALIIILIIVSTAGLYSVYDQYKNKQEIVKINTNWESQKKESDSSLTESSYFSSSNGIQTNNLGNTWNKTVGNTTGYDWLEMNTDQKKDIVSGVIIDWESNNFEVSVSSTYFISALNAFYGDESTNNNNLAEAMSMIGLSGNVLNKK